MSDVNPTPGIEREARLSEAGLQRLERQLERGGQISDAVLAQWVRRYGEAAREIIARHGRAPAKDGEPE